MKTILIIEDDIVFSRSISNWLVKEGMKTDCVTTIANARKAIWKFNYDKRKQRLRQIRKGKTPEPVEGGRTALSAIADTLCAGTVENANWGQKNSRKALSPAILW